MKRGLRSALLVLTACVTFAGAVFNQEGVSVYGDGQDVSGGGTDADISWENYGQTIYNTTTGMLSNNVSSIAQTDDGVVWIGTDKGLAAYDGNEFTEYGTFYHFDGVNDITKTVDGGVWFATTTYGGAVNLGSRFQHFDDVSEYASNYATSIAEGSDGYIYVGTLKNMLAINPKSGYVVTELIGDEFYYATSIAAGRELAAAVTVNGNVVFMKDAVETAAVKLPCTGRAAVTYADGYFLVGMSDSRIAVIDESDAASGAKSFYEVPLNENKDSYNQINRLYYDGERLWVLTENGIGYFTLGADGIEGLGRAEFHTCRFDDFESGFSDMMVDYQGNYWISSTKRGILLLRKSDFTDELAQTDINVDVINSVMEEDGILYAATDSGVAAFDAQTKEAVVNEFTKNFVTGRITDIITYKDKKYVAVYGEGVYAENGEQVVAAARVNRLMQLDGELYVLTDEGCIVWDGKSVTAVYGSEEGLYNTQLTAAISGVFGKKTQSRVFLASAGAGIYVFEDGNLVEIIDENSGLPSKQVNDMTAYDGGFFIATDSGAAYYNGRKLVELSGMPASLEGQECKNIFIRDDKLYAVCEKALFVINLDDLFGKSGTKGQASYELYDEQAGFFGTLTDGGHDFMTSGGRLYLICGRKIYSYVDKDEVFDISSLKVRIQSVSVDNRVVELIESGDGQYEVNLTKDAKELDIMCSVLNFSNEDPYVRYIMPGMDDAYTVVRLSELGHIIYEDLEGGSHTFWFELLGDEIGEDGRAVAVQTIKLTINKEQKFLEKLWVRMVLLAAAFGILMYFVMKDRKKKNIEVDKSL